jgi:hypothetical protein
MNWDAIGALGEILGAVAVVISLGYVAVQIRQNTEATKDLAGQNLTAANTEINYLISTNDDLARILYEGTTDRNSLKGHEQLRFNTLLFGIYNQFDFAFRRHSEGKLEEASWIKIKYEIPLYLHLPGWLSWWHQDKARFSAEFVAFVDNELSVFQSPSTVPTMPYESHKG